MNVDEAVDYIAVDETLEELRQYRALKRAISGQGDEIPNLLLLDTKDDYGTQDWDYLESEPARYQVNWDKIRGSTDPSKDQDDWFKWSKYETSDDDTERGRYEAEIGRMNSKLSGYEHVKETEDWDSSEYSSEYYNTNWSQKKWEASYEHDQDRVDDSEMMDKVTDIQSTVDMLANDLGTVDKQVSQLRETVMTSYQHMMSRFEDLHNLIESRFAESYQNMLRIHRRQEQILEVCRQRTQSGSGSTLKQDKKKDIQSIIDMLASSLGTSEKEEDKKEDKKEEKEKRVSKEDFDSL